MQNHKNNNKPITISNFLNGILIFLKDCYSMFINSLRKLEFDNKKTIRCRYIFYYLRIIRKGRRPLMDYFFMEKGKQMYGKFHF